PQSCRTEWSAVAAKRFVDLAQNQLKAGDRVKALGAINRVMALRPDHPEAPLLLRRIERRSRLAGRVRVGLGALGVLGLGAAAVAVSHLVEEHTADVAPLPVDA